MAKRKLLNVREVLENNVYMAEHLHIFKDLPQVIVDHIQHQGFLSKAILRKNEKSRKDIYIPAK